MPYILGTNMCAYCVTKWERAMEEVEEEIEYGEMACEELKHQQSVNQDLEHVSPR